MPARAAMGTDGASQQANAGYSGRMDLVNGLIMRREKLEEELRGIEKQLFDMETVYLNDSSQQGASVLKGFDTLLSSGKSSGPKRTRTFKLEDRVFSLSSSTSPATEENATNTDSLAKFIPGLRASMQRGPEKRRVLHRRAQMDVDASFD